MLLGVLQPWEPEWLVGSGGDFIRSPSRCQRHRVSSRSSRFMVRDPWTQWRALRPKRHTLDGLFEQFLSSSSLFDVSQSLNGMLEDASEPRESQHLEKSPCRALCGANNKVIGRELCKPLKWQLNDTRGGVRAEMQLPRGLRRLDDLSVELDEATRTITLKAENDSGSDNCGFSAWAYSQRLDESIDLSQLQASIDFPTRRLQLRAPTLQTPDSTQEVTPRSLETKPQKVNEREEMNSEEEQPPEPDVEISSDAENDMEDATMGDVEQPSTNGTHSEKEIEIEDVGPDEDSDRISISSSEGSTSRPKS